ncbi:MAG TPA: ABC transporter ATP-binding protein [Candidatus Eisenbacteria bacterium]|nr:ABC transporter ATP-binding protein [Candidatus Eisenbacteria bacterium]
MSNDRYFALAPFVQPYRTPLAIGVGLIILHTLLDLAAPWPLKFAIDNVIDDEPLSGWLTGLNGFSKTTRALIVAFAGVTLVAASSLIGYVSSYLIGAIAEKIGGDIRCEAFRCLERKSLSFHDQHRTGDLTSRLTQDVADLQDFMVLWFDTLIPEVLSLVGMLTILFMVDGQMAVAALAVVPLLSIQVIASRTRIRSTERESRNCLGRLSAHTTEVLRHIRAVQAFSRELEEERRFRAQSTDATAAAIRALELQARYFPTSDVILAFGSALILFLGVIRVVDGHMTIGTLLVILTYLSAFYHPIRALTRLASVLARGAASRERLAEVFSAAEPITDEREAIHVPNSLALIKLESVTFAYRPDAPVLRNVSFQVCGGEFVCIVGATGAGKSTLLSLLLRFYDPTSGMITVNGIPLQRFSLRSLRERIALVPQDTWILDGTIADNIRFGRADATEEEINMAGRLALVDEFAARLPDGYDTVVGESGTSLSGGQRRRIALARAIVRNAPLLLLDEPTSGLDAHSEAAVIDALENLTHHRTVIAVSHRLKLVAMASRVIVLQNGQIVEEGDPRALIAAGGVFARLWIQQSSPIPGKHRGEAALQLGSVDLPVRKNGAPAPVVGALSDRHAESKI